MRILRIAIRNYRGVEAREVSIPATGITIVEGPNEVGKSSLAEALDILLELPHDSSHRRVEAIRPVHRGGGTEVEAEFTTGPYHLVYFKRWFHRPETRLTVLAPAPESVTARTAHDRVRAILDETLDWNLYRALRYIQGERIEQGDVGKSATLVGALDQAASGGAADPRSESTLWEAVRKEWALYFTPTGRVSQAREHLHSSIEAARERARVANLALEGLENDGEKFRDTSSRLMANTLAQTEAATDLAQHQEASRALSALAFEVEQKKAGLAGARTREQEARQTLAERHHQAELLKGTRAELDDLLRKGQQEGAALQEARVAQATASELARLAQEERDRATRALNLAQDDMAYRRAELDNRLLSNRLERVQSSHRDEVRAQQFIDESRATTEGRKLLEKAVRLRAEARAAVDASSATMNLEPQAAIDLSVDGEPLHLEPPERHRIRVTGEVVIEIPGRLTLQLSGGGSSSQLRGKLREAENTLAELTQRFGLTSADPLAELNEALERRAKAEHDVEAARSTRAAALEDLTEEELEAKVQSTGKLVEEYLGARDPDPPVPESLDQAQILYTAARERLRLASDAAEIQRTAAMTADSQVTSLLVQAGANDALVDAHRQRLAKLESVLDEARAQTPDDVLEATLREAEETAREQEALFTAATAKYLGGDPEGAAARLENAEALMRRLQKDHLDLAREQAELETTLRVRGSTDFQSTLDEAEKELARLGPEYEGLERRARAAKLLMETFSRHRDLARQAYVAPYEEQIQRLAQLVFGKGTEVRVDPDDFSMKARTVSGVTVPFESLSTGAREQLAVLGRLACAILVNPEGTSGDVGAPVILDDALGNSDATRLRNLAPAFASAGGQAQVIIMTSSPDRYRHLGEVNIVRLDPV